MGTTSVRRRASWSSAGPMLVATQAASSAGSRSGHRQQQAPGAGRRLLDVDLAAARELEHDARLAQRVVQALGAGHEGREADRGTRAQARGDAQRRRRRGRAPRRRARGPGAAPTPRRPPAARARRGTARRWWGRPSPRGRAAGRTARSPRAPARSRRRRRRPSRPRRLGAGALAQRAQQGGPAAAARRLAHEGQRHQGGTGVQLAQGRPGQGVAGCSGGRREGHADAEGCQPTLCARSRSPVRRGWRLPCCRP